MDDNDPKVEAPDAPIVPAEEAVVEPEVAEEVKEEEVKAETAE